MPAPLRPPPPLRRIPRRARSALLLALFLGVPVLLAACTLPSPPELYGKSLRPDLLPIGGLTPEHERSHPTAIALAPDGTTAYVLLPGTIARPDHRIAVVDLESGTLTGHRGVGLRPIDVVHDPTDPNLLWIAHPYSPAITVLDTRDGATHVLPATYYLEGLAFADGGSLLLAADRDQDRLVVYTVDRDGPRPTLEGLSQYATGPNPEHIVMVPGLGREVAAISDRHGGSVTLVDLDAARALRVPIGGPPLALTANDGLLFVAGYGPGDGRPATEDGTAETGAADVENSLLVLDLRGISDLGAIAPEAIPRVRYLSDTAHPDQGPSAMRILAGAAPRSLQWDLAREGGARTTGLWITYHGTDQVQRLDYNAPGAAALANTVLATPTGAIGTRLSHLALDTPLAPGVLSDPTYGVYETPPGPRDSLRWGRYLLVVAELSETLHIIDLADCPDATAPGAPCTGRSIPLVDEPLPYPTGLYEQGERLFVSALPSADQDRSCAACHIDGLATGGTWALPHRDLEPVRIPRLDTAADSAPWLLDGAAQKPADYLRAAAGGGLLAPDATDPNNLARTRPGEAANESETHPGAAQRIASVVPGVTTPEAWMDATFAYAMGETRLLPAPPRLLDDDRVARGARLYASNGAACMSCHADGDAAMLLPPAQAEGFARPGNASAIKAPPLVGLWDRQGTGFLYDGRAGDIAATLLPPGADCATRGGMASAPHDLLGDRTCESVRELVAALLALRPER